MALGPSWTLTASRPWTRCGQSTARRWRTVARMLFSVFGRLRPGVSLSTAREAVRLKARQLERAYPATNKNVGVVLMREQYTRPSISGYPVSRPVSRRCS